MLSLRSVRLSVKRVVPLLNVRFASADCSKVEMKKKPCEDFEKCKGRKVPNQKEICNEGRTANYRKDCLQPQLTEYKRKVVDDSAWAVEPEYNNKDFNFIPGAQSCVRSDDCCEVIRMDDEMYRPNYENRVYAKTWLDCIEDKPKIKECPPLELKLLEMEKRKPSQRPETATLVQKCPAEEDKGKCPRAKAVCSRKARFPPTCTLMRKKKDCLKRCCPFPSFSECCLEEPLPPPKYCECKSQIKGCSS